MRLIESIDEMMALIGPARVVLVPTMGALHDGHATLVREARSLAGKDGTVVVSIFVNPTQFAPGEDFESYPRNLAADRETCAKARADIIFHPSPDAMYAAGASIEIAETKLSQLLCGASRPTHFGGVCTVVAKLFNLVRPDIAVFGKKDYQQLAIIRRLAADTRLPRDEMLAAIVAQLHQEAPLGQIDYLELVDAETLERIERVGGRPALLAIAVFFGKTRLIDNLEAGPLK